MVNDVWSLVEQYPEPEPSRRWTIVKKTLRAVVHRLHMLNFFVHIRRDARLQIVLIREEILHKTTKWVFFKTAQTILSPQAKGNTYFPRQSVQLLLSNILSFFCNLTAGTTSHLYGQCFNVFYLALSCLRFLPVFNMIPKIPSDVKRWRQCKVI